MTAQQLQDAIGMVRAKREFFLRLREDAFAQGMQALATAYTISVVRASVAIVGLQTQRPVE